MSVQVRTRGTRRTEHIVWILGPNLFSSPHFRLLLESEIRDASALQGRDASGICSFGKDWWTMQKRNTPLL